MSKWHPYALKKPCADCPFLKEGGIELAPGRLESIVDDLVSGESTSFMCHKTVHHPTTGGEWISDDGNEETYVPSNNEQQCAGSLILLEKMGHRTQLMQVMHRLGMYNPMRLTSCHDHVIDPETVNDL